MAGVQRGGRGKVECEREARREHEAQSLGARLGTPVPYRAPNDRASRSHSTSPSLPFVRRPRRLYGLLFGGCRGQVMDAKVPTFIRTYGDLRWEMLYRSTYVGRVRYQSKYGGGRLDTKVHNGANKSE